MLKIGQQTARSKMIIALAFLCAIVFAATLMTTKASAEVIVPQPGTYLTKTKTCQVSFQVGTNPDSSITGNLVGLIHEPLNSFGPFKPPGFNLYNQTNRSDMVVEGQFVNNTTATVSLFRWYGVICGWGEADATWQHA